MTIRRSVTRVWAVFKARNLEYLRDRASFGWNLVFPILIVLALAVVFSGPPTGIFSITYLGAHDARPACAEGLGGEGCRRADDAEAAHPDEEEPHNGYVLLGTRLG